MCDIISDKTHQNHLLDMRIVPGMAGTPEEPSSHKVRKQNIQVLRVVAVTLNQYKRKVTI